MISGSSDRTLKIWDIQTGEELLTLSGHTGGVRTVAKLPEGQVVSGSSDNTIKVWNLHSQKLL
ncbi:WD40 repeat domain-containing protein [Okeania sp. KiyG1]|uniref:WD40 repeat domain-containing protein n=1 Tax=Okeania sp. KiyG1 TaxID=2720165 RepID=UPI001F22AB22|nr:hypothetical protein [Okeania sp. KiyG1]